MTRSKTGTLVAMLAITAAAACSTMNQTYVSGGDVDLSTAIPAQLTSDEMTMLRQMSDADIIGHIIAVDSLEITLADTALRLVKQGSVSAYAKQMHLAHEDDWKAMKDLAATAGLIPTRDVSRLRFSHVAAGVDSVRRTSDATTDQQFMRAQIELHKHALAELQVLEGVPTNMALRQHITAMIPVVRDHLARAMAMAKPLGIDR
jgi:predicted outer membrane protein